MIVEADTSPVCCQEAGDPGRLAVWVQSKSEGLRTRGADGVYSDPRAGSMAWLQWAGKFPLTQPFCSMQAFSELADIHPH